MALLIAESFDTGSYTKGWQQGGQGGNNGNVSGGRWGTSGYQCLDYRFGIYKGLAGATPATVIMGCAIKPNGLFTRQTFIQFSEAGVAQFSIGFNVSGAVEAYRSGNIFGVGGTTVVLGASAPGVLVNNAFAYVEAKVLVHPTAGTFEIKVNGTTVLSLTGLNTRATSNSWVDTIHLADGGAAGANCIYDDLYVCDNTGATNNDYLGDIRVEALFPSGDGNSSQLVGSDGNSVNNSLLVDENPPNGDTDYVQSGTPGDKDTYAFTNLTSTTGTVLGVILTAQARKDDAGARSIVTVARLAGTEADGPVKALSASYIDFQDTRETKPGGGAWSITDVNAAEFGVKVNA